MSRYSASQWLGPDDDRMIASETNPWVEVDGVPITWVDRRQRAALGCGCGSVLRGVMEAMDTDEGVQRCDECGIYPGDLEAAAALAGVVGGTVWFYPSAWVIRIYDNGWTIVADKIPTQHAAKELMELLVGLRHAGNTGFDICEIADILEE